MSDYYIGDAGAWTRTNHEGTIDTWNEDEKSATPLWVVLADADQNSGEWVDGYKRESTPNSRVFCHAKRLIGRFP